MFNFVTVPFIFNGLAHTLEVWGGLYYHGILVIVIANILLHAPLRLCLVNTGIQLRHLLSSLRQQSKVGHQQAKISSLRGLLSA